MSLPRRSFNRIALHHPQLPSALYVVCRFICLYLSIPLLIPGFYILSKLLWSVFACVGDFADSCLIAFYLQLSQLRTLTIQFVSDLFINASLNRFLSVFFLLNLSPLTTSSFCKLFFHSFSAYTLYFPFLFLTMLRFCFLLLLPFVFLFLHSFSTSYYSVCGRMSSFSSSTSYISWYMPVSSPFHSLFFLVLPYPILFFPLSYDRVRLGTPLNQCDFSMHIQ